MRYLTFICIYLTLILVACDNGSKGDSAQDFPQKGELIVYCENSMVGLVLDLKESFEAQYDCEIKIQNDCSQNLMGLISYTGKGDVYLPSSTASFKDFYARTGQALMDSVFIGYNNLVFMVEKGNPGNFDGQFSSLLNSKEHALIIANPEMSSVGLETRKLLEQERLYNRLLSSVVALTSDSKGLSKSIKNHQADVIIDWESNWFVNGNRNHLEVLPIQSSQGSFIPVYAASLSCSTQPELTKAFLQLADHQLNESRLTKYGFTKRRTVIF